MVASHGLPLSHVGIAVRDLEAAIARYATILGYDAAEVPVITEEKVRVALFARPGDDDAGIELIAPLSEDSPVAAFLRRRGEGVHHIAVYVDGVQAKLNELKRAGVRLVDEVPRIAVDGSRFAFVHPLAADGVLIELEERPRRGES